MKNILVLSLLIPFAMICSCQKQDLAAEQQLAQRKVELDAREDALIEREKVAEEREKALDRREKALAENEKAANTRTTSPDAKSQDAIRDAAQAQAEEAKSVEQIRAEMLALLPDNAKLKAQMERAKQEQSGQKQPVLEELQRQKQRVLEMSGAGGSSALEAASATPSPQ